jgi:SAM-dependent methyltransferase
LHALRRLLNDVDTLNSIQEITDALAVALRFENPMVAPYFPSPQDVVDRVLSLAGVQQNDVVYDLGCGDGRVVITAARKYRARGVGVDLDRLRIKEAEALARRARVGHLVRFELEDLRNVDFSSATVVTLFLRQDANLALRSALTRQLEPGARIVSHHFGLGDWVPDKVETFQDRKGNDRTLYLWTVTGARR